MKSRKLSAGAETAGRQRLIKERRPFMKRLLLAALTVAFLSTTLLAAGPAQYQVTGPVLEVKDDVIIVHKDSEKWAIARTQDTKVVGDLKVGSKVTVFYTMTAVKVEVKEPPKKK
jgi:hypothetical protein